MMTLSYFYTNNIPESIKLKDEILKLPCLNFFKVDVDQALDIARKYAITTVPTMMIFKDGEVVDKMIGFLPKEHIKAKIEAQL